MNQNQQLLLLEDIHNLGRKGDLVRAKAGFVRNFLVPQKKAVIADKRTLRMRDKLQEERRLQAIEDKKDAEAIAHLIDGKSFTVDAKVDHEGHMYGSIGATDIVKLLKEHGATVDRHQVSLGKPLKTLGVHSIPLKLKEGVKAAFTLVIEAEGVETKEKA